MKGKMNIAKLLALLCQKRQPRPHQLPLSISEWARKAVLGICLLAGSTASSLAGYSIKSHVESLAGTNYYTWTVYNQDQSWGLDGFAIEVPLQTRVLARTIPPPY